MILYAMYRDLPVFKDFVEQMFKSDLKGICECISRGLQAFCTKTMLWTFINMCWEEEAVWEVVGVMSSTTHPVKKSLYNPWPVLNQSVSEHIQCSAMLSLRKPAMIVR